MAATQSPPDIRQLTNLNRLFRFFRVLNIPLMAAILAVLVYFPLSDQLGTSDIGAIWTGYLDQLTGFFTGQGDSSPIYTVFTIAVIVDIIGLYFILGWLITRNQQRIDELESKQMDSTDSAIHPS